MYLCISLSIIFRLYLYDPFLTTTTSTIIIIIIFIFYSGFHSIPFPFMTYRAGIKIQCLLRSFRFSLYLRINPVVLGGNTRKRFFFPLFFLLLFYMLPLVHVSPYCSVSLSLSSCSYLFCILFYSTQYPVLSTYYSLLTTQYSI